MSNEMMILIGIGILGVIIILFLINLSMIQTVATLKDFKRLVKNQIIGDIWKEAQPRVDAAKSTNEKLTIMADTYDMITIDIHEKSIKEPNVYRKKIK